MNGSIGSRAGWLRSRRSSSIFDGRLPRHRRNPNCHRSSGSLGTSLASGRRYLSAPSLHRWPPRALRSRPASARRSAPGRLPSRAARSVAAGIASIGVVTAIAWSAQIVAGLGLIGAMLVPVAVVFDAGLTVLGTGFVALMLAAAGVVGVVRRWPALLVCAAAASLPQIADVVAEADPRSARASVLGAAFALLYAAIGIALQRRRRGPQLDGFPASFVLGGAVVGGGTALLLYQGPAEGLALLAAAAPFALAAASL